MTVKISNTKNTFGETSLKIEYFPESVIIIARHTYSGYRPFNLCLTHQVNVFDLLKECEKYINTVNPIDGFVILLRDAGIMSDEISIEELKAMVEENEE